MSTEAEEASKVLATEQEFWNGMSTNQEEKAHEGIPLYQNIRSCGCLRARSRTSTWLTETAQ